MINDKSKLSNSKAYLAVFAIAAILYVLTCAPSALWQDSGMIQYRVWHNDVEGKLGLALSHPLFYMIAIVAKYIPIGNVLHRINITGAIIAALAVANIFLLLKIWTKKTTPAIAAAVTLALSHTFWRHAAICETYNLYIAIMLAELIVLLRYFQTRKISFLYMLGFLNGLSIANHMLGSIGFTCYFAMIIWLIIKKQIQIKPLIIMAVFWIVGALPYEILIIKNFIVTGDIATIIKSALFGQGWQKDVLNCTMSLKIIKENLLLICYNFPSPLAIFCLVGLFSVKKPSPSKIYTIIFFALLTGFLLFAFRYTVVDRYAFFIPFYTLASILAGLGCYRLSQSFSEKKCLYIILGSAFFTIFIYNIAPSIAKKTGFNIATRSNIAFRDDYKWFLQPWRTGYKGADEFATAVFEQIELNGVIAADNTTVYPLLLNQQINGQRPDIKIISAIAASKNTPDLRSKPLQSWINQDNDIYLINDSKIYTTEKIGVIWKIIDSKSK